MFLFLIRQYFFAVSTIFKNSIELAYSCWERPSCTAVREGSVAMNKNPKTSISDITKNLHREGMKVSQSTIYKEDLERSNMEVIPQDASHSSVVRICRRDYNLQRRTEVIHKRSGGKFLWTDETDINLYQSDGKTTIWRKRICEARWRMS